MTESPSRRSGRLDVTIVLCIAAFGCLFLATTPSLRSAGQPWIVLLSFVVVWAVCFAAACFLFALADPERFAAVWSILRASEPE